MALSAFAAVTLDSHLGGAQLLVVLEGEVVYVVLFDVVLIVFGVRLLLIDQLV